ncbi:growth arrest and DNA damage-inducible proteins-interacting protein 1 [Pseudomyrmex gracilis]|uniref:growth arrest and DNA damage-inducible proteins-interacting protein 1 n=1 Tax=Pseudomyrmex gracilis TaxID=219809 RepID=UPI0009949244|nr:growth arrest and DNA damage-inducible proteins-interacting protein 1 [Pseudomyrmex gracilis]
MSLRVIYDVIVRRNARLQGILVKRLSTTESTEKKDEIVDITAAEEQPVYSSIDDDPEIQAEINRKRNKSRLNSQHRNMLMDERPYDSPLEWYHNTVRYKRRMLGRYGLKGNDEPIGFAWPKPEEIEDAKEYERVAFPLSLQERWKKLEEEKQIKAEEIRKREEEIEERLGKMKQWTAKFEEKIAKKEAQLEAAKQDKERLIEEVRKHFGFKISPNDERFKEMLAKKEKEEKKKKKEAKKKARMEKFANKVIDSTPVKFENNKQQQATDSTKDST